MKKKERLIVILGPTASGKSDLAVDLALKFNGEVVSADSRQVYKGMNIGTGKITKKEMRGVKHHLLDVVSPKKRYTVADFQKDANGAINEILKKGKLPILCGGTGFYIRSIVDGIVLPEVPPNKKLRKDLSKKTVAEMFGILKKLDPERAKNIDSKNPARLIRAIEIAKALGKVPNLALQAPSNFDVMQIGIKTEPEVLKERILRRLEKRIKMGMILEAKKLHEQGLSWKRMEELGLEYRYLARFLQGKISKKEMMNQLNKEIWHYAQRQMTWFKRDKRIGWFGLKDTRKIKKETGKFLN
jgi:tRNA dimethylallyltransferase